MKKNILAENLIRFGVKNLNQLQKRRLIEAIKDGSEVEFNGETYYVWSSTVDFDQRGINTAKRYYKGKSTFNPNDFIIINKRKHPYGYDLSPEELDDNFLVINSDEVDNGSSDTTSNNTPTTVKGTFAFSREGFLGAIADKINELNGNKTSYTSAELDTIAEQSEDYDARYKLNRTQDEYEMSLNTNGTVLRETDFNVAIAIGMGTLFSHLVKDQNKFQTYYNDTI